MRTSNIVRAFILGSLVEVAIPKPGNVSRLRDFPDLTFYHFLFANTSLIGPYMEAARRGELLGEGVIDESNVGLGQLILLAIKESKRWQDANPNFGVVALSVPLIVSLSSGRPIERAGVYASKLIEKSTPYDSINFYKAIRIANPKGIRRGVKYDVYDDSSFDELVMDNVNLYRLAEVSCPREMIFCEWLNGYSKVYEALDMLEGFIESEDLENAVLKTFLNLLARYRDTLIERKAGIEEAELVRKKAELVVKGELSLGEFSKFMAEKGDLRNPGSLADIVAVALSLLFLRGYRLEGSFLCKS
ncbi:triphosphoribosyl-dephospho-CoA synthase [Pyrococcus kukulkanii]|uniref:triphosphoribosyl-dephospho-CoA synthase n=1 Tax=Pyrococcus kukulkanii TaxID=1609559 RepID=UPI00356A5629